MKAGVPQGTETDAEPHRGLELRRDLRLVTEPAHTAFILRGPTLVSAVFVERDFIYFGEQIIRKPPNVSCVVRNKHWTPGSVW